MYFTTIHIAHSQDILVSDFVELGGIEPPLPIFAVTPNDDPRWSGLSRLNSPWLLAKRVENDFRFARRRLFVHVLGDRDLLALGPEHLA